MKFDVHEIYTTRHSCLVTSKNTKEAKKIPRVHRNEFFFNRKYLLNAEIAYIFYACTYLLLCVQKPILPLFYYFPRTTENKREFFKNVPWDLELSVSLELLSIQGQDSWFTTIYVFLPIFLRKIRREFFSPFREWRVRVPMYTLDVSVAHINSQYV